MSLATTLDTVRRMSARQLGSRVARRVRQRWLYPRLAKRLFPTPPPLTNGDLPRGLDEDAWVGRPGVLERARELAAGRFTFLGLPTETLVRDQTRRPPEPSPPAHLRGRPGRGRERGDQNESGAPNPNSELPPRIDWSRAPEGNRLWQYELHYGQWALDLAHGHLESPEEGLLDALLHLLDDWIEHNPVGIGVGWEPYPITRRLVAWVRAAQALAQHGAMADFWHRRLEPSLRQQTRFLAHNLEFDVPNNHLLANFRALAWMGLACPHWPEAAGWRRRGLAGLWRAMDEQVLDDGVHDERSLSYHVIVASDLLETWCLARHEGVEVPTRVATTLERMLGVVAALRPPGSSWWPLLNDSVPGYPFDPEALLRAGLRLGSSAGPASTETETDELERYGRWLGGEQDGGEQDTVASPTPAAPTTVFPRAGWAVWRDDDLLLLFDAGAMGPDKVLGHGHADTLGFELHTQGGPRLVDPGVITYESGPWRERLRSTAAHNTVRIDDQDQCEFWGPFRVAFPPTGRLLQADDRVLEGEHDGYRRLADGVVHRRRIERVTPRRFEIHDHFTGRGNHRFGLGLQWAPGAQPSLEEQGVVVRWDDGCGIRLTTEAPEDARASLEDGAVAGGWNQPISAPRWVLTWRARVPCSIRWVLEICEPLTPRERPQR